MAMGVFCTLHMRRSKLQETTMHSKSVYTYSFNITCAKIFPSTHSCKTINKTHMALVKNVVWKCKHMDKFKRIKEGDLLIGVLNPQPFV
jgi:hypothetical protein